jgi:hypothetical protein
MIFQARQFVIYPYFMEHGNFHRIGTKGVEQGVAPEPASPTG